MANPIKLRLADLLDHDLFTARELSWLSFNARVLQEAADKTVPLIARLRYLGIFSNNLDEFFRVRVAEVRRLISMSSGGDRQQSKDLLSAIQKHVVELQKEFDRIYDELLTAGIEVLYDDRDERPGAKFKAADLQGMPWQVVVGGKGLKDGVVELTNRGSGEKERIPIGDVVGVLAERVL